MRTQGRDRVAVDVGAVAVQGAPADRAGGDVLQPVGEPRADEWRASRGRGSAGVPEPLELANLAGDFGPTGAHDMAAVGLAEVVDAHRDPAVPVAVGALVGGRGLVGC